ncbi:conserved hypothetical protein [Gloeothece citriformis PCC 7424]|uniref:DUF3616 domain-containing protein n=1 Tax=Gloeothece citriformis (strain PCC 7424) TaxID=65393 RepID=B7K8I5_GLOC7|nr:DUF3616 domain-containing protein [Gloeothece citriformis]ACK71183.1 conserved hypothetical protein [Gloeothece citriformis PCC 7424]
MKKLSFKIEKELQHQGTCDASGSVAIEDTHYFILGNDEDNILRIYDAEKSGEPVEKIDTNSYFKNNPKDKEVDIEAAALLDGVIYWITSHGRNKKAKEKPERCNFFANKITVKNNSFSSEQVGESYSELLTDMFNDKTLKKYNLKEAAKLAPKAEGGLNIEGLCITPSQEMLIGFRNPIPDGKALLLPLKNPKDLIEKKETCASFGEPIELDLGGLGIRSIVYWEKHEVYFIVAGSYDSSDNFQLYQWSGNPQESPEVIEGELPQDFKPEDITFYPNRDNEFQLLSDDGSIKRDGETECKDLPENERYFRSLWMSIKEE